MVALVVLAMASLVGVPTASAESCAGAGYGTDSWNGEEGQSYADWSCPDSLNAQGWNGYWSAGNGNCIGEGYDYGFFDDGDASVSLSTTSASGSCSSAQQGLGISGSWSVGGAFDLGKYRIVMQSVADFGPHIDMVKFMAYNAEHLN